MRRTSGVQIVLVRPASKASAGDEVQQILESLYRETDVAIVGDAAACLAICREREIALVVVDAAFGSNCAGIVGQLRDKATRILVAGHEIDAKRSVACFRAGAADSIALQTDGAEALALAARDQVARARSERLGSRSESVQPDLENYHENVIQNLNTALLVVDTKGRITSSNPPAEQILGEASATLRGVSVSRWFGGTAGGASLVTRTLADGSRFRAVESFVNRRDGTRVPIGISWAPIFDSDGYKLGAVATFQDITGLKSLQSHVLQAEKMASIGQLAAGVAHEINNPMGFIHANLFQMSEYVVDLHRVWESVANLRKAVAQGEMGEMRRAADTLSEVSEDVDVDWLLTDLGKAIRESQEGSERIRHIVQDLRDFSHQDKGEVVLADVNQCLESTTSIVWPMMKHLVVLEKDYGELPNIYGYPMQLKQVFMNLLVNAYQSIEERVGESGETGTISLVTRNCDGGVSVTVRDTGVGIAPDAVDRIFDPFFTTKKVGSGTGLGLSTSYSIIKRHAGSVKVDSSPGEGATFSLFLPLGSPDESQAGDGGRESVVGFE